MNEFEKAVEGFSDQEQKGLDIKPSGQYLFFDVLLIEAERLRTLRIKDLDLYFYDEATEEYRKVGEAYREGVSSFKDRLFHKRKTRYFITFTEALDMEDGLKPVTFKLIRHFARVMTYGNIVKGYGVRDIINHFKIHQKYVTVALNTLLEKDIIRYRLVKNHRIYMVNPTYYCKSSPTGLFSLIKSYSEMPTFEDHKRERELKKKS